MIDHTPRYAPDRVLVLDGGRAYDCPVTRAIAHPPGTHPGSCIKAELTAVELQTAKGSRWYGFERAYINSELRLVVEGFDRRDEVRAKWALVPEDRRV